jgi:4-diphosphocytidyl-2-C-methyl-D-erythritol kinase
MTRALRCYAKINMMLEVLGKRTDGYHEIRSVLQTISLHDRLEVEPAEELVFTCTEPALAGEANLVVRAARLLQARYRLRRGARLRLEKHIPSAAGLGGGSSDAAATLVALTEVWGLALPHTELAVLAAELGSDVPFFLIGGTALATGRGEQVQPLPPAPPGWAVLVFSAASLATAAVYQAITPADYSNGAATTQFVQAAQQSRWWPPDRWQNSLTRAAVALCPQIAQAQQALAEAGAPHALLCGSGPTVCAVFDEEEAARQVQGRLLSLGYRAEVASFVSQGWEWEK